MKSRHGFPAAVCGLLLVSMSASLPAAAQAPAWSWPEKAKNLKVLPADTTPAQLRATMMGFTRGLGVRCTHCHVGEEGKPLSTFDFASDANPRKDVARNMVKMLGGIETTLGQIRPAGDEPVAVSCWTCHRGRPEPRTLADEVSLVYARAGADSALAHYQKLRERFLVAGSYDFREPALNDVGYRALGKDDARGAVAILKHNATLFPESPNAHDSLAEAYLTAGERELAITHYEKSLQLDPKNQNAAKALEKLRATGGAPAR